MCIFRCLGKECPSHCCGPYGGVCDNLRPLGSVRMSEIILLPKDTVALERAGYSHLIRRDASGITKIDTAPDGTCAALADGRCSVYAYRPAICRAYPLYLDMFSGVCTLTECKAVPDDICLEDYPEMLENLLEIYLHWIDFYRKKLCPQR